MRGVGERVTEKYLHRERRAVGEKRRQGYRRERKGGVRGDAFLWGKMEI